MKYKVIHVSNDVVFIGARDGSFFDVPVKEFDFTPVVGDEVQFFRNGDKVIVLKGDMPKKNSLPQSEPRTIVLGEAGDSKKSSKRGIVLGVCFVLSLSLFVFTNVKNGNVQSFVNNLNKNTDAIKENTEKQEEKTVTNEEVSSTNMPKRVDESNNTVVSSNTQEESKNNVMSESQKMYQIKADDISMRNLHNIEDKFKEELSLNKITNDKYIELMNNVKDLRHAALTVGENGVEADTLEVMSEVLKELKGINANTKQEKVPVRVFDRN